MASSLMLPTLRMSPPHLFRMGDLPPAAWNFGFVKSSAANSLARWRCNTMDKPGKQDNNFGLAQEEFPTTNWNEKTTVPDEAIPDMINKVKAMLSSMGDGEISVSAYDTAWVALVPQMNGKGGPHFPSSLEWIESNQLHDGSWGDADFFSATDRTINTLACVIALKSWGVFPEHCQKGLVFLKENMWRIGEEDATMMPIGYEIAFPSLMEIAQELGLELPYNNPALQGINKKRNLKLEKVPTEVLHKVPTPLLFTLEGLANLDWDRLLKLQCIDGSFLFSPASTAHALVQTGDKKCLQYLDRIVHKFNGGVPNAYPVDLFEHVWAVDRLERLGIARHFESEINECMAYVHKYWTNVGICWARNSAVQDIDNTAMGFRLLRLHGYDVSPDVFKNLKKDDEFFCFVGQTEQAVTGMFDLNLASQVIFPGEVILDHAGRFSNKYLREKQAANQLTDKWIITKDLPGEVEYGLNFPWYASLPRMEARMYLQQYGGGGDIWIGKTLFRMFHVNSDLYLELAKLDFNHCQSVHQLEWTSLLRWYNERGFVAYGVSEKNVLMAYFLAAASIYEPERASERLGWAQSAVIAEAISYHLSSDHGSWLKWQEFLDRFLNRHARSMPELTGDDLMGALDEIIDRLSDGQQLRKDGIVKALDGLSDGYYLRKAWEKWLMAGRMDRVDTALLLVRTIEVCGGRSGDPTNIAYDRLCALTSSIFDRLSCPKVNIKAKGIITDKTIDLEMQFLVQCVFQSSDGLSNMTKQTFFNVAKSYYYCAHCPATTLEDHIMKVLFDPVI